MNRNVKVTKTTELRELKQILRAPNPAASVLASYEKSSYPEVRESVCRYREKECLEDLRLESLLRYERDLWNRGFHWVAGIDEAGRGPLAGPVAAAAVILDAQTAKSLRGLDDSKKLSAAKRYELEIQIKEKALAWAVAWQNQRQIDRDNILEATKTAMIRAVGKLPLVPEYLLLDAVRLNDLDLPQNSIIKGDQKCLSIAAASVLAKCWRDRLMEGFHTSYPQYGFIQHKGYPTAEHRQKLALYGPSILHRHSFVGKEGRI